MSVENLKNVDANSLPIGKLVIMISRGYSFYLNHKLEQLGINTSQLHYLFEISRENNINQKELASRCNIDKGAVARSIKKLEDDGLIIRITDENNRRQNKLSLTSKGEKILSEAKLILVEWENQILKDVENTQKEALHEILKEIAIKTIEINENL